MRYHQFTPLSDAPAPAYARHIGMRWARFVEDGDKPGTGVATTEPGQQQDDGQKPPEEPKTPETGATDDEGLNVEGLKSALAAERAAAKKHRQEAADANAKLQQIEDAKLSDIDKAVKERDTAAQERDTARTELAVYKLAAKHGITDESDVEVLLAIGDETKRAAAAARLAPTPGEKRKTLDPVPKSGTGSSTDSLSGLAAGRALAQSRRTKH